MNYEIILALVGTFGLGSVITAWVSSGLTAKRNVEFERRKILEEKYRTILIHMACALDVSNRKLFRLEADYEKDTEKYFLDCCREYYYHSLLYSPDAVIRKLKDFVQNPTRENYIESAMEMRKDLWESNSNLELEEINIEET